MLSFRAIARNPGFQDDEISPVEMNLQLFILQDGLSATLIQAVSGILIECGYASLIVLSTSYFEI